MNTFSGSVEKFRILAECSVSKARVGFLELPHYNVETPVFMPVGTKGCMKGVLPEQLEDIHVQILLGNTYHLGLKPGLELLRTCGGLHQFMNWKRAILTDSGGFQMVSLVKLSQVTEEGVQFESPYSLNSSPHTTKSALGSQTYVKGWQRLRNSSGESDDDMDLTPGIGDPNDLMMLTPEKSMEIQNCIGADIIMQLDDVVSSVTTGPRVKEAMERSVRWLDRCNQSHSRPTEQYLFPIVQGGLDPQLREECVRKMVKTDSVGYAIGGLSGGEAKSSFWQMVNVSTDILPKTKPRYVMGVGYAEDLVVCSALGADMFDCVFPTRTARFGCALTDRGQLNLKSKSYKHDFTPIDSACNCLTCRTYTRSYLHHIVSNISVASRLVSVHNINYQMDLMRRIRESIRSARFPEFVKVFMKCRFENSLVPDWISDALASVNIHLETTSATTVKHVEALHVNAAQPEENLTKKYHADGT